jgi:hypothetical protein
MTRLVLLLTIALAAPACTIYFGGDDEHHQPWHGYEDANWPDTTDASGPLHDAEGPCGTFDASGPYHDAGWWPDGGHHPDGGQQPDAESADAGWGYDAAP